MRHSLLVLLALAACGAAAETPVGGGAASPSAAAPSGDKKAAALPPHQRLQRLVTQAQHGANANQTVAMVRLAKEMVKGVVKKAESSLPAERTAISMLDCLTRAAATATAVPVHRGQLLVEHAKLLNALGRVDKAREMAEAATQVFESELKAWAANPEAGTPSVGPTSKAREHAAAALGSLLDVAALWRQLGREDEANALLEGALRAAPLIPSTPNFLRGLAQLSQLSEQQLDAALKCAVHLEREIGYTGAATIAATQQAESAPAAAATDAQAEPGAAAAAAAVSVNSCAWMKIKRAEVNDTKPVDAVPDMHRLYYALHRGLHARKRYGAAWQALARAKVLHYSKHTYKQKDFQEMVDDVEQLFPSPLKFVQAVAPEQPQEEQQANGEAVELPPAQGGSGAQQAVAGAAGSSQQPNGAADGGDSAGAAGQGLGAGTGGSSGRGYGDGEGEEMIPIFVMGLPRSGSTLAEQILSSHPQVYGAGEHSSLRSVTGKLQALIKGNGTVTRAQLDGFRRTYLAGMRSKIPPESRSSRWLVDKALSNAWLVGHIALMMPNACLVHAVRHPADAALSAFQQSFFPDKVPWSFNLTNVASHVRAHHRLMALWDRVLPGRVLHLHYAHMVQDQEATTRKLVEHCRLPWDPAFLRFYENERSVQTASQLQVKKPIYSSSLRKWPAYTQGLAPLLVELKDTILAYEAAAGLPLSDGILDQVQRELIEQQQQEQAAAAAAAEAQAAATSKEEL